MTDTQIDYVRPAPWLTVVFAKRWFILAITILFAILFPSITRQVSPPSWEGRGLLRVGTVDADPIEPVPEVVDRLNSRSFQDEKLFGLESGGLSDSGSDARLRSSFRARMLASGLIELRARGINEQEARQFISAPAEMLVNDLQGKAELHLKPLRQRLAQRTADAALLERNLMGIMKQNQHVSRGVARNDALAYNEPMMFQLFTIKIQDIEAEKALLVSQLNSIRSRSTALVDPPDVRRVGVGILPIAILAIMGAGLGFLLSAGLVIVNNWLRRSAV
ncbi:MAG TPA: hypothetical protein VM532_09650 [Burkholderiales bacterium]|jgi:hypothetical protein|nr:hypothetical protein [Burkholderiales bacterium]